MVGENITLGGVRKERIRQIEEELRKLEKRMKFLLAELRALKNYWCE